ncbi:hypothetical protein PR048_009597 [Dryococelus australis]|uniref:Uncharacterized protein n=1 Tax=Dryococelus australis TaxID=614101 RepID=A0ABQ9I0B3_9NEOP|nr:hypothetical protein PR048_009597 [Dryococelus australis]
MAIEKAGQEQLQEFAMKQLVSAEKKIMDPIKCNKFQTFKRPSYPPSLCAYDFPCACNKADFIKVLQNHIPTLLPLSEPSVDAKIFDGAAVFQMIKPGDAQSFQEYMDNKCLPYVEKQKNSVQRINVVWDIYKSDSLKQGLMLTRKSFLNFWEDTIIIGRANKEVYSTLGSTVICSSDRMDNKSISPCNHEEADTCVFLHTVNAAKCGLPRVLIRATDIDVVVIGVSMYQDMGLEELWLSFRSGKNLRHIPLHEISKSL